jgi:hypothetical protein
MATALYEWKTKASAINPLGAKDPNSPAVPQAPASPSFGDLMKSDAPAAGPTPSFNDLLGGVGEARAQNVQGAQQAISQGFQPQEPSQAGQQARNAFLKSQDETQRQVLEASALAGRGDTGQIVGDNRDFLTKTAQPARMDFESQLQAQEEAQARQGRQDAFGNLIAMEGLGSQERTQQAQNALTARGQDITVSEGAAERQSREAVAFAGLNLEEKRLAQEGSQFQSKQDFDKWALGKNLDNDTAQRIWQSIENAKQIASTEKLGFANLSVREKELTQAGQQFADELAFKKFATEGGWNQQEADRAWKSMESDKDRTLTTSENALDRELNKYLTEKKLNIDEKQLGETIRQFDSKLAFDQWATQGGFDQQDKDRIWDAHLQDLQQQWQTGERLGSQDHQVLIEDKRIQAQTAAQEFDKLTQLEVLGKTQEWDKAKLELTNTYQTMRDQQGMSHDMAMEAVRAETETRLTQMGISADVAKQAADIQQRQWETERELAQQNAVANAELLYKYESLREQTGLQKADLELKSQELAQHAAQFLQTFGLEEMKAESLIKSQEMKDLIGTNTLLFQMAGDNKDMVDFATKNFIQAMGRMQVGGTEGGGAPLLSPEEVQTMLAEVDKPAPTAGQDPNKIYVPKTGIDAFDDATGALVDPYNQFANGNYVTGIKNSVEDALTLPFKALKSLKFW